MDALDLKDVLSALDIHAISHDVVEDNSEIIADMNASQLAQGIRADDKPILPAYRPLTIELKSQKTGLASVTDHVTLFDKSDFYKGLEVEVVGDDMFYGSTDSKADRLQRKYGFQIFGLNDEHADELTDGYLRPQMIDKVEKKTGLTFPG